MAAAQPIRNPKHVRALMVHFKQQGQYRNHVLVAFGIYTALRISDILNIKCKDVYDFKKRRVLDEITLVEKKTGKTKTIALNKNIKDALKLYFHNASYSSPLILNESNGKAITRVHAFRLINDAAIAVGIPFKVSCHSLRKTFGYHAWKKGAQPALLMDIYNHTSYTTTKRYLGITQDDQNSLYRTLTI